MPTMITNRDEETWHDQKPSHPKMSTDEQAARQAETMVFDAADWLLERAWDSEGDEREIYYDAHFYTCKMLQNAFTNLLDKKTEE